MKKKIMLGVGVLVVVLAAMAAWLVLVGNKRSPQETVALNNGGLDVKVVYCRPFKKERLIFGDKASGAVVPYDTYWRLGANAATAITFGKDASFAGKPVKAGTYRMYAVPGAKTWKVTLANGLSWGAAEPDHANDVLTVEVASETLPSPLEQFQIRFATEESGAKMEFAWDTTVVRVPLAAN